MPIGVSILLRFAAMVCIQTIGTVSERRTSESRPLITTKENGTKVKRETSLVISMLPKKQRPTKTRTSCNVLLVWPKRAHPKRSKTPCRRSPAITVMREKRMARVRRSI